MVALKSINIVLRSQYDALVVPEFPLPSSKSNATAKTPRTNIYIPIYENSQFWICYDVSPPHPPSTYFYFKMFIDGTHVVSWGCGEEDRYQGTTMFGLYERDKSKSRRSENPQQPSGGVAIERRSFFFPLNDEREANANARNIFGGERNMEIKVYRSNARRRIARSYPKFQNTPAAIKPADGIDLRNSGKLERSSPQRFYQYALVDPLDQPFASFRYLFRTWDELRQLGIIDKENIPIADPRVSLTSEETSSSTPSRTTILSKPLSSSSSQKSPSMPRPRSFASGRKVSEDGELKRMSYPSSSNLLIPNPLNVGTGASSEVENKVDGMVLRKKKTNSLKEVVSSALRRKGEASST